MLWIPINYTYKLTYTMDTYNYTYKLTYIMDTYNYIYIS